MELSIRREKKLIQSLEKNLEAFGKSYALLVQMDKETEESSTENMEEQNATFKQALSIPNARFMSSDEVDEDLIQQYGSKTAHLFVYVKQLYEEEENRIIIFSQWDRMLGVISAFYRTYRYEMNGKGFSHAACSSGNLLEENDIPTVSCRGPTFFHHSCQLLMV